MRVGEIRGRLWTLLVQAPKPKATGSNPVAPATHFSDRPSAPTSHANYTQEIDVRAHGRGYRAVLTPDPEAGGYTIEVPELLGCITEADHFKKRGAWLAKESKASSQKIPKRVKPRGARFRSSAYNV